MIFVGVVCLFSFSFVCFIVVVFCKRIHTGPPFILVVEVLLYVSVDVKQH